MKTEWKVWGFYFVTILFSIYLHEIGHCLVAWIHGYAAVPTPAKAYLTEPIPSSLNNYFSLGGIIASVLFPLVIFPVFMISSFKWKASLLAGSIAMPGLYSLRFLIAGRGHDGNEFQEAQAALGLNYSGHFLDILFFALLIAGILLWIIKSRPSLKMSGRIIAGIVLTFIFVIAIQKINNRIFDPLFS